MTPSLLLELRPRGVLSAPRSADANCPMTHGIGAGRVTTMFRPSRHREIRCNDFWLAPRI